MLRAPAIPSIKPIYGTPIDPRHPLSQGVLAHYVMNEGGGQTLFDKAGNNNGTLVNSPLWAQGRFGTALSFDGTTQRVTLNPITSGFSNSFTVSAWIYPTANAQSVQNAFCVEKAANYWVAFGNGTALSNKGTFALFDGTHNPLAQTTSALTLNRWTHLVGVRDANQGKLFMYQDGILQSSVSDTTTSVPPYSAAYIGAQINIGSRFFSGSIDDLRLFTRALTAGEVAQLYAQPFVNFLTPTRRMIAPQTASGFVPAPYYYTLMQGAA